MIKVLEPLVRKLDAKASLSDQERSAISALSPVIRKTRTDHDIVVERDKPSHCCLVIDGWLCRYKLLANGSRQIMSFHIAGDIPDLHSLYIDSMDHNLGSLTPGAVALIPHEAMKALIGTFPHLGEMLWRDMLIDAAIFRQWIVGLGRKAAHQRLAHLCCETFVRMQIVGLTQGDSCPFPLTQATLGDALGLSTVHVNRSLMYLRACGLIKLEKHVLSIPRWAEIASEGEFDPHYLQLKP